MDFRTTFPIIASPFKVNYDTPVMLTGSCFANEIGDKMAEGKMKVMINPTGTVYNPVSIRNSIRLAADNKITGADELYFFREKYMSFLHYTDFTSEHQSETLNKINNSTLKAHYFLQSASFLVVTFGTARVYRLKESGEIVSNCHKLPQDLFTSELLTVEEVVTVWTELLDLLRKFNNKLRVIFTVSPVRHIKDGAHGNQVSKSVLFLAIEELLAQNNTSYFPAYELLMDDLRDYRYYADDMLHPSGPAIDYIWEAFTGTFFEKQTLDLWKEISKINLAMKHILSAKGGSSTKQFASAMLARISSVNTRYPKIDLSAEESYFRSLQV